MLIDARTLAIVAALTLLAPSASTAQDAEASPLVAACDAVAANVYNTQNPEGITGQSWDAFDAQAALAPCTEALTAYPDHLRTIYHLGRANHKLGNEAEAERLYQRAAEQDYVMAFRGLIILYGESDMPQASQKLVATTDACAALGIVSCQTDLADMYVNGSNALDADPAKALALFEAAAAKGDTYAQSYAGWMYDEGAGVAEDDSKAVSYYLPAAEAGDFFAQNNLAVHYDEGKGVAQDEAMALYWYEKAAAQGDAEDQFIVGERYRDGIGTTRDFYKAAEWFRRAAAQGHAYASAELEQMIADGLVVPGPAD